MILGIDLGTTNSLVAVYKDGDVTVIPNRLGSLLTPSVVSVDAEGTVYVGGNGSGAEECGSCQYGVCL